MLTRRRFLGVATGATITLAIRPTVVTAQPSSSVFDHGVASGDPLHDRVILWTRVTPSPEAVPGSGLGPPVDVTYEIATAPNFAEVVVSGVVTTTAAADHTVHVDVDGLDPGRFYWYRFAALDGSSPVGRTKTAAAPDSRVSSVRMGIVTCAEYEFGYFGAYRHLAKCQDLDAVVHLGDYIYEFGLQYGTPPAATPTPGSTIGRGHEPPHELLTLTDYRTRYGQYRRDADLLTLHAAHPMIAMYDDHEVANDTWRDGAQQHQPDEGDFATRAAAARQAWREWIPLRQVDAADVEVVHRSFRFGTLVELWMLDERQYRDQQPANAIISYGSVDPAINDPARTLLGTEQRDWLLDGLADSGAAWKVLGNPVPFFPLVVGPALPTAVSDLFAPLAGNLPPIPPPLAVDDWNGYAAEQRGVIDAIDTGPVEDVILLTGDYHESFVADIPARIGEYRMDGNSTAVEFIVPSVTTPGLGETLEAGGLPNAQGIETLYDANLTTNNPWVRYHEGRSNGFGVVQFDEQQTHYDFWFLSDRLDPASPAAVAASWKVDRGTARATEASGPLPDAVCPTSGSRSTVGIDLPATGSTVPLRAAVTAAMLGLGARLLRRRTRTSDDE